MAHRSGLPRGLGVTVNAYATLNNPKMVHMLKRLSDAYLGPKHEHISIDGPLTIEHIMPQNWIEHWPFA